MSSEQCKTTSMHVQCILVNLPKNVFQTNGGLQSLVNSLDIHTDYGLYWYWEYGGMKRSFREIKFLYIALPGKLCSSVVQHKF